MKTLVYARAIDSAAGVNADSQAALSVGVFRALGWLENLLGDVVQAISSQIRTGAAIRELCALDDRILADLGIDRGQIPEIVASMMTRQANESVSARDVTAGSVHLGA